MRDLLVDHFTETPTNPRARFGIPEPELRRRVDASVRQAAATLTAQQVQHQVLVHEQMRSIRVLPAGTATLNQIALQWDVELDGLGLVICPLLFIIHPGAHGAYSPFEDLMPGESRHSADLRWLEARLPRHAILLRSDAVRGIAPACFVLRHELDHARRSIATRRGRATIERASITLDGETGQQLFFGGKLEIEEVFVHAADIEAVRLHLLQVGVRTYPGPAKPTWLAASLREADPSAPTRIGQMQMTACIGGAIAEQALGILPGVRAALRQGQEPTSTSRHGILWGALDFNDPALGSTGALHLPLGNSNSSSPEPSARAFELCLAQLEATLRDHLQLHQWVQQTISRFGGGDLAPQRFGRFLDVTALPAAAFTDGYRPLAPGHFEARFGD